MIYRYVDIHYLFMEILSLQRTRSWLLMLQRFLLSFEVINFPSLGWQPADMVILAFYY